MKDKNVDNTEHTQNVLSLCPGILGLERGIERGIRAVTTSWDIPLRGNKAINVVAYVEIEAFIIANLVGQMEAGILDAAPIWTNVKTFDALPFRNKVHGIIGGYPCQPFSLSGERKGTEDPRHLWPYILEQIKIIGPEWVFFENVGGHLSLGYAEVRRSLSDIGYRVEEGIFTAEEVGAPHRRERLFIFGVMENAGILGWGRRNNRNTKRSECEIQTEGSGTALENPDSPKSNRAIRKRLQPVDNGSTETMANPSDTGLAQWGEQYARSEFQAIERNGSFEFPTGQGRYQYEWEEPRTIESSMVYTINGYNFTEDLHRAIGNSVVEQTAEIAFVSLLKKHIAAQS
ncbi:MAG: DNA cytosine methyltransferase [Mucilaginibacter sp.]|uniref:DNA cytosine methyltransferase n=1 Tax=Mucilaginibacter sp. TaxID=1882438 RepID=UPI003265EDFD